MRRCESLRTELTDLPSPASYVGRISEPAQIQIQIADQIFDVADKMAMSVNATASTYHAERDPAPEKIVAGFVVIAFSDTI